ncbi:MAG: adenylate kinase [Candidatus Dormibacteria bacterium]
MRRVSVVGNSGSGKSRLAAELSETLGAHLVELDAVIHQKGWVDLELDEFRRQVSEVAAGSYWVIDGNYSQVRHLIWGRADTVVWLDLPRRTLMTRVIKRTLERVVTRRELWNGNRETWRDVLSFDPYRSIVAWAWVEHRRYQAVFLAASLDKAWAGLRFFRVQGEQDRDRVLSEARATMGALPGFAVKRRFR